MEYKEIVAVTGEPGLFQLVSSKGDGAIVRTLNGETTRFVPSRNHNFTPLESIEVFTQGANVPLSDVFRAMQEQESSLAVPAAGSDGEAIRSYFTSVFPSLDEERVYMSDMKKMLKWYPQLKEHDLLQFPEEQTAEAERGEEGAPAAAEQQPEARAPETAAAEAAPAKEKKTAKAGEKDKKTPAKKTTEKKAAAAKSSASPEKKAAPKKTKAK
jgi:hypothetical protein